jgi:hypothetical protein
LVAGSISELYADKKALREVFPPLQLIMTAPLASSSFVTADVFSAASTIPTDSALVRLTGTKIIGPI